MLCAKYLNLSLFSICCDIKDNDILIYYNCFNNDLQILIQL